MDEDARRPIPDPTVLTTDQLLREIKALRELLEQRIEAVDMHAREGFDVVHGRFEVLERRRLESKEDTQAVVDAALIAQKEAVAEKNSTSEKAVLKAEASTTKQLDQLKVNFNTSIDALNTGIVDLKERVNKVESVRVGRDVQVDSSRGQIQAVAAVVAIVVGVATIIGLLAATGAFNNGPVG